MALNSNHLINGGSGMAYIRKDGKRFQAANVNSVDASVEFEKMEKKALGKRMTIHKITSGSGSGTLNMSYMGSVFRDALLEWRKTGKQPYFDLDLTNDDPSTPHGRQTVVLYNCLPDEITLSMLDSEGEELEEEIPFTFEDFDIPEKFKLPDFM